MLLRRLLLTLCALLTVAHAQTAPPAAAATVPAAPNSAVSVTFPNGSAMIILPGGTQSLTQIETMILRMATVAVYPDADTAKATLINACAGIAAAHGAPAGGPYTITGDFSVQVTMMPPPPPPAPTWSKVAVEGQTVTLPAGTVVRFGAKAGTKGGVNQDGAPLTADQFGVNITIPVTQTIVVNSDNLHIDDPVSGYVKELDVLSGTGTATVAK